MRIHPASIRPKPPAPRQREAEPQSRGRLFKLARMAGIAVSLLALVLFVAMLPTYVTYLHTVCTTPCAGSQLPARTAQAFQAAGLSLNIYADFVLALTITSALLDVAIAALLLWRASKNGMALLVGLMLVLLGTISLLGDSSLLTLLLGSVVAMILAHFFISLAMDCVLLVLFLFPNGRFVPSWMRWFVIGWIILMPVLTDLLSLSSPPGIYIPLSVLDNILWVIIWLSVIGAQFYRYRHVSTPREQQQTRWVLFGFVLLLLIVFGLNLPQTIFPELNLPDSPFYFVAQFVGTFSLIVFLPLFFGIAILGYRLWDIDIIIKRTLVYGTLTVILTLVYVGLVIGLQFLLRGIINQGSGVAIVISTLAIAALFQPLRRRIQRVIDRRFYRSKYDAAKTVEAFSTTLRQEVDLEQLREHLLAVVQETMQPAHVSLWLRPPVHDGKLRAAFRATPPVSSEGK